MNLPTQKNEPIVIDTTWAYLAGMLDGEGYFSLTRHYKYHSRVSSRGYDLYSRIVLSNMNLENLNQIQQLTGFGRIQILRNKKKDGRICITYELRFCPNEQRTILPKITPYLIQKKTRAKILLKLLDFRAKGSMISATKVKPLIEQYYLDLEQQLEQATLKEKPWSLTATSKKGRKKSHTIN